MERIAKYIARCGVTSRRKAEDLIHDGVVSVNGKIISEVGTKIDPERDAVKVRNTLISLPVYKYFLINKPKNTITTKTDTHERKTVLDLLPKKHRKGVYPVGRLDKNTTGLLILTNDGDLTYRLTHPRYGVPKTYRVLVAGMLSIKSCQQIEKGVQLDDGMTFPARIKVIKRMNNKTCVSVIIKEGRKRQVRRVFEALGHRVLTLERTQIGPLRTGGLREGDIRPLEPKEVAMLKRVSAPKTKGADR